jgi:hypothetical protein
VQVKRRKQNNQNLTNTWCNMMKTLILTCYNKWSLLNHNNNNNFKFKKNHQDHLLESESNLLLKRRDKHYLLNLIHWAEVIWKYYSLVHQEHILNHSSLLKVIKKRKVLRKLLRRRWILLIIHSNNNSLLMRINNSNKWKCQSLMSY